MKTQNQHNAATQVSRYCRMLLLATFLCFMGKAVNAQIGGGALIVSPISVKKDSCSRGTGSFTYSIHMGMVTGITVENTSTHVAYFASASDPFLFENLPAGNYSIIPFSNNPNDVSIATDVNIGAVSFVNNNTTIRGCGSVSYLGNTYTQSTSIVNSNTIAGCTENFNTSIQVFPIPSLQLNPSKNVLGCNDSALLTITGSNLDHVSSVSWQRNNNSFSTRIGTNLVTTAGTGSRGTTINQFNNPLGVAFDALGNMYVGDYYNNRVLRFPAGSTQGTNGVVVAGGNGAGSAIDQLDAPGGIFIRGNFLYVCDYWNNRVMKYPTFPSSPGGSGVVVAQNGLDRVNEVFVTVAGEIYVSEHLMHRVQKFPANSTSTTVGITVAGGNTFAGAALNELNNPVGIYVAANGDLYIADRHNHRIVKWAPNATSGVILAGGNGQGNALNQFNHPVDVDFDAAGNMYVSEETGARVMYFPPSSNQSSNGIIYLDNNVLNHVGHIAFDNNGFLNTADGGNHRVVRLDKFLNQWVYQAGTYTAQVTMDNGCTTMVGLINITSNVTVARDTIRVNPCSTYVYRGVTYTSTQTLRDTIKTTDGLCDSIYRVVEITVGNCCPTLDIVNVSGPCANPQILRASGAGAGASIQWFRNGTSISTNVNRIYNQTATTVAGVSGVLGTDLMHLNHPHNVTVVGNDMYIADWSNQRVLRWTIGATSGTLVAGNGTAGSANTQLNNPNDVAVDASNNLFINEYVGWRVSRWNAGSTTGTVVAGTGLAGTTTNDLNYTRGMARDAAGNLYISDAGNAAIKYFPNGSLNATVIAGTGTTGSGLGQVQNPAQIRLATDGRIYLADQNNNRILVYPAITGTPTASNGTRVAYNLSAPWGIALDAQNNIYVAETGNHRILYYTSGTLNQNNTTNPGQIILGTGTPGSTNTQLDAPAGMWVDNLGRIFIADDNNHRIQMFTSTLDSTISVTQSGTYTCVVTYPNGCTSTDTLIVNIPTVVKDTIEKKGCGQVVHNGITYKSNITICDPIIKDVNGCDSVQHCVRIIVNPWTIINDTTRVTEPCGPVTHNGITYKANDTLRSVGYAENPCRQTNYVTIITVNPRTVVNDTIRLSGCDSVIHNGETIYNTDTLGPVLNIGKGCSDINLYTIITVNHGPSISITNTSGPCTNPQILQVNGVPAGSTVVWNYVLNAVGSWTSSSNGYSTSFMDGPVHMVRDAAGNIYVAESNVHRIVRIDAVTGVRTTAAGGNGRGAANNQFAEPCAVTLDGNDLIITDHHNHRIVRWTIGATTGTVIAGTGSNGAANNELYFPLNAVVGPNGRLYVADRSNHRVMEYLPGNTNGTAIITAITNPHDIDFINNNEFLVVSRGDNNVLKYNLTTSTSSVEYTALNQPYAMYIAPNGDRYLTQVGAELVTRYPNGSTTPITIATAASHQISYPCGITVDNNGCVIVSQYYTKELKRLCNAAANPLSVTQSGTYTATVTGANGCSSTASINVTIPTPFVRDTVLKSGCGQVSHNGIVYKSSTVVCDAMITSVKGCDSVQHCTKIVVTPYTIFNDTTRLSGCNSVTYNKVVYTQNDTIRTSTIKEDSCIKRNRVVIITIQPYTIIKDTLRFTGCDSFVYNGITYTSNTTLNNTIINKDSCIQRNRTIIITINTTPNVTICNSGVCNTPQVLTLCGTGTSQIANVTWTYNGSTLNTARRGWNGMGQVVAGVTGQTGTTTNRLGDPHGVFVVGNDMYISDWNNNRILRWAVGATSGTPIITGVNRPSNVFVNNNLDVYVTEYNANKVSLWTNGSTTGTIAVSGLTYPRGMFIDGHGRIIVSDNGNNTQSGSRNQILHGGATNQLLQSVAGLNIANIFGRGNNIYYASQGENSIKTFNYSAFVNSSGTISGAASAITTLYTTVNGTDNLSAPWGLHVQGNNLYVTENGAHRLVRYTLGNPTGTVIAGNGSSGTALDRFDVPNGVFADARGRIFVADGNNHRVLMFDSTYEVTATQSGTYTATVTFANGCTRTITTNVAIPTPVQRDTMGREECGSYTFRGITYTTTTTVAKDTIRNVNGCDSLINYLHIEIKPWKTSYDTIFKTSCDSLVYNGKVYRKSTTIVDTISSTTSPCSRIIRTVNIIIRSASECACFSNSVSLSSGLNVNGGLKNVLSYDDNWVISNGPSAFASNYSNSFGAFVLNSNPSPWSNTLPGTQWISPTADNNFAGTGNTPFVFKRTICGIDRAMNYILNLEVLCDDSCSVLLDGVVINQNTNPGYNWQNNNKININQTVYLTTGPHIIEIRLSNSGTTSSPIGVDCKGSLSTIDGSSFIRLNNCCINSGVITGVKVKDLNFNGMVDLVNVPLVTNPDDLLSGFTIQLKGTSGNVLATALTDNFGQYSFANIPSGNYTVNEIQQTGYLQSFPANNASHNITVIGGTVTQANFANVLPTRIKQTVTGCNPFVFLGRTFTSSIQFFDTTRNSSNIITQITEYNVIINNPVTASATITASQTVVCLGSNATLTATTTNAGNNPTYQWFKDGVMIPGATTSSYVVNANPLTTTSNNLGTYYCSIGVDPTFTCVNKPSAQSNSINLTVGTNSLRPTIIINHNSKNFMICAGTNIIFTATITNGGSNPQYQWVLNGVSIPGATSSTYSSSTLPNGSQISCNLTSNANCSFISLVQSNVITLNIGASTPVTSITGPPIACVNNGNINLIAMPAGGVWSSTAGRASVAQGTITSTTSQGIVTPTSGGNANIRYTITNPISKCVSFIDYPINVGSQPEVPSISYALNTPNPQLGAPTGAFCRGRVFEVVGNPAGGNWTAVGFIVTPLSASNAKVDLNTTANSGSLTYTITNAAGCSNSRTMSSNIVTCKTKGIANQDLNGKFNLAYNIYPNPAKNILNIKVDNLVGEAKVIITDLLGKQLQQKHLSLGVNALNINNYAKGMYLVSIITNEGTKTEKIVVE